MIDPKTTSDWLFFLLMLALAIVGFLHLWTIKSSKQELRTMWYWTGVILILWQYLALSLWPPGHNYIEYQSASWLIFIQFTLSAGILGAVVNAMICGHWYLVNQYLSMKPIDFITRTLLYLILCKFIILCLTLVYLYATEPNRLFQTLQYYPVLFGVRILAGLIFGFLLTWMGRQTLQHENTQAATGILYACITFIFMGEFSAYYLTIHSGIAF